MWGQGSRATGGPGVQETPEGSGKGEFCRRLMSELWCHQSVSPAPGKGVKGQQGHTGGVSDLSKEILVSAM